MLLCLSVMLIVAKVKCQDVTCVEKYRGALKGLIQVLVVIFGSVTHITDDWIAAQI